MKKNKKIIMISLFTLWFIVDTLVISQILFDNTIIIFGTNSIYILFGIGIHNFLIFIIYSILAIKIIGFNNLIELIGSIYCILVIIFLMRVFSMYSFNPIEEFKFVKNIFFDSTLKQTEIVSLDNISFNIDIQDIPVGRRGKTRRRYISRGYINEKYVYSLYRYKYTSNDSIIQTFLEDVIDKDSDIKIEYFKHSKIIKSIIVDGKEYNDIDQIYSEYTKWNEGPKLIINSNNTIYFEYKDIDLIIDEWDKNYNKNKCYTVIHDNIKSNYIVSNFRTIEMQEIYKAYDLGEIYFVELFNSYTNSNFWQITLELGKDEYFGVLEFTPEQEKIIRSYPAIQVKRENL